MGSKQSAEPKQSASSKPEVRSEIANRLSADDFTAAYVEPVLSHVDWREAFLLSFRHSSTISKFELDACVELVRSTSEEAYKASSSGWSSRNKLREMKDSNMRFLLVCNRQMLPASAKNSEKGASNVLGFLSFMLTVEDDIEVVYCYEIHVAPELRGRKIGATLMRLMEGIGQTAGMSKSMLTVFTSNESARAFYKRMGYNLYYEEEPPPRKRLRSRITEEIKPSYLILAKDLLGNV